MADLFEQTGIPTGEIGALPLPALSPDELGLPLPLQQALNAPPLPRPTAPPPVMSDPKQRLAALAALGFALGAGPHGGGAGAISGLLSQQQALGQQNQQRFQHQQAEIDKQNQQLEIQQRAAAADLERRRVAFANAVKILEPQIRAAKTPEQYRSAVTLAAGAMQGAGFRTPPQWFMQNLPFQAPTLEQEAKDTVTTVMKSDAVKAALQKQGDQALDTIAIPLHLQGPSQPATPVTLRDAHKFAGIDIGVQQGHVVQTPLGQMNEWQAALDQAANEFQVSFKRAPNQQEATDRLWIEKRAREIQKPPKPADEDGITLTPAGLDAAALNYTKTGQLPPMGMSKQGGTVRSRIINRAAELTPGLDVASNKATYTASSDSLKKLQSLRDSVVAFERTAGANLDRFLETAKTVAESGLPVLNRPYRSVRRTLLGDPKMAAFDAALLAAQNEVARVLNTANLNGQLSDSARHEMQAALSPTATIQQLTAAVGILRADMTSRRESYDAQIREVQQRLRTGTTEGEAAPPPPVRGIPSYEDYLRSKGGRR